MLVYHKVVLSISCGFPYSSFQTGHLCYHHHVTIVNIIMATVIITTIDPIFDSPILLSA